MWSDSYCQSGYLVPGYRLLFILHLLGWQLFETSSLRLVDLVGSCNCSMIFMILNVGRNNDCFVSGINMIFYHKYNSWFKIKIRQFASVVGTNLPMI